VTVVVSADTEADLFERSAYAVFDLCFALEDIAPRYSRPIVAPGNDLSDLLFGWLSELLAASADASIAFSMFNVDRLEEGGVQGWASGMPAGEVARRSKPVVAIEEVVVDTDRGETFTAEIRARREPMLRLV